MIRLKQAVVVEGKYDKIKLSSLIDAVIIQTNGYGIFKDSDKLALIRYYAAKTGIIIMTDSDSAGFKIRNFIKGAVNKNDTVINVYIPDIFGKEKRKLKPSCEGKLGVEGVDKKIILEALEKAGVCVENSADNKDKITKTDLFELGLSGGRNSSLMRKKLLVKLSLPELLSASAMLDILNIMMDKNELEEIVRTIGEIDKGDE